MLKRLALFAFLFGALLYCASQEKERSSLSKVQEQSQTAPSISPVHNETSTPNQQCSCAETPPWWKRPEWWLCILGVPTLWFVGWQARETRKAAQASEVAVAVALKQAEHMVNSERAWVMAELKFEQGTSLSWGSGDNAFADQTTATVILSIRNSGSTPAWVYEQFVHLEVSPRVLASLEKYESPNFPFIGEGKTSHVNYEIHPLTQGDDPIGWKAWVSDVGIPTPENGLHVYIYGVVRYRDAFNTKRETYFGYSVKGNNRLERIPNEAYNKHT
jgi:hypothetical protein